MDFVLAVHGGAGTITVGEADEAPYHEGLRDALEAGTRVLGAGGTALDAVVAAVMALEDCPLFNAGRGAVFNAAGEHELDAGVMDGATLRAGSVAAVHKLRNPVSAAREVLLDGRCVVQCGHGAEAFAAARGLTMVPNSHFSTQQRHAQWLRACGHEVDVAGARHGLAPAPALLVDPAQMGTVGAVALDQRGHLAAATSTGGQTNKRRGRIGDSPLIGAGVYANSRTCAVSATGTGEHFIRACAAHDVHARMQYGGARIIDAAAEALFSVACLGGIGGLIALGRDGTLTMPFNSPGMYRGWVRSGEAPGTAVFA